MVAFDLGRVRHDELLVDIGHTQLGGLDLGVLVLVILLLLLLLIQGLLLEQLARRDVSISDRMPLLRAFLFQVGAERTDVI